MSTVPIIALTMFGLAIGHWLARQLHTRLGASSPGVNVCFLIVFGVFWTVFEFATITANTIFGALLNDVVPQTVLGRFSGCFVCLA
jgi:maltose/moltooligosaccharide transporter